MTERQDDRLAALRAQYEAGRIDANAYISAGGDPAVVDQVESAKAAQPLPLGARILKGAMAIGVCFLLLTGVASFGSPGVVPPIVWLLGAALLGVVAYKI